MKRRVAGTLLVLAAGGAAACSGGGDSATTTLGNGTVAPVSTPTIATPTTATPTTTAPATPPPAVTTSTVAVVSTTIAPASSASTAPAPSSTDSPDLAVAKQAVIAAATEAREAFWALRQDPLDGARLELVRSLYDGESEQFVLELISEAIASGQRTVRSSDVDPAYFVFPESVDVDLPGGVASLRSCEVDSWILVQDVGVGSEPVVLDERVVSTSSSERFVLQGDVWVRISGTQLVEVEGLGECDLSS